MFSAWQESIKHGGVETWERFFLRHLSKPYSSNVLNGVAVLNRWNDGVVKIHVINYDDVIKSGDDVCASLLDKIPISVNGINLEGESVNQSLDYSDVELMRVLNLLAKNDGYLRGANVRKVYLDLRKESNSVRSLIQAIQKNKVSFELGGSWVIQSMENYFFKSYPFEKKVNFMDSVEKNLPSCDSWLNSEILDLVGKVYKVIKERLINTSYVPR